MMLQPLIEFVLSSVVELVGGLKLFGDGFVRREIPMIKNSHF